VRSVYQSVPGWKAVLKCNNVLNASCNFYQKPDWNLVSWSNTMELGTPCSLIISSRYARASWSRVQVFLIAMKCAVLVSRSTITQIVLFFLWVRGKPTTKSMDTKSHFHSTQGRPTVVEVPPATGVQSSPFDRLSTLPHNKLLLTSCCSIRMSALNFYIIYFPLGAQSVEYYGLHRKFSS